jgi:hypothetical protein
MRRTLFLSIMHKLSETSPHFSERYDTTGRIGLIVLQKCATIDEYLKLGKSTVLECLEYYCVGIIECFRAELLCRPTVTDTYRLLGKVEERGFSGMLGSIVCMH